MVDSQKDSSGSFSRFVLGFVGMIAFGFFVLVAVGFYQTEFSETKNVSSAGNSDELSAH